MNYRCRRHSGGHVVDEELSVKAAQCIMSGDYMGAMENFEAIIEAHGDSPVGYHGWAEAALFEIQANGNFDEKGNETVSYTHLRAHET